jgi:hypothetical protein
VTAFEIGRNDWAAGSQTEEQHYANVVSYISSPSKGLVQKGWEVRVMANIAGSPALMPTIEAHRAALRDPQFLTDTLSENGQPYAGKVSIISTDLVEHDGAKRFIDS